jgi:hypothetical protein
MTLNKWHAWATHADENGGASITTPSENGMLYLPFDAGYLLHDGNYLPCIDSCIVKPIPSKEGKLAAECVEFPDMDCPICKEPGHSINDSDCKNPVVSIRSRFLGCRKCYDEQYTGLANAYLYDMCRIMGLDFDWLN